MDLYALDEALEYLNEGANLKSTIKEIVDTCIKIIKGKGKEIAIDAMETMITQLVTAFFDYYRNDCEEAYAKNKNVIANHLDIKSISCEPFTTSKGDFIAVEFRVDMDKEFLSNIKDDHVPSVHFSIKLNKNGKAGKVNHEIYFDG